MIFDESTLTKKHASRERLDLGLTKSIGRAALAPLEIVFVLPLLMMFMGVIIIFGYAATWKIRSEVVARDVAWKARYPRHGIYNHSSLSDREGSNVFELHERSPEWPERRDDNEMLESSRDSGQNLADYANDEVVVAPIVRGAVPNIEVNNDILDFTRSISEGFADISRPSPIMPETGRVDFLTPNSFMDDEFQFQRMGWSSPGGVGYSMGWGRGSRDIINFDSRRIPVLWELELDFLYDDAALNGAIHSINNFRDPIVMAIDEDMDYYTWMRRIQDEFIDANGNRQKYFVMGNPLPVPPNPASYQFIPDFSPLFGVSAGTYNHERQSGVSYQLDRQWVMENIIQPHVDGLDLKAVEMAEGTMDLFQLVLDKNEDDLCSPPLTQSEISQLEGWIEQLRKYAEKIRNGF